MENPIDNDTEENFKALIDINNDLSKEEAVIIERIKQLDAYEKEISEQEELQFFICEKMQLIEDRYNRFEKMVNIFKEKQPSCVIPPKREEILYDACSLFHHLEEYEDQRKTCADSKTLGDIIQFFGDINSRIRTLQAEIEEYSLKSSN